jgi:hypothetical protein
VRTQAALAALLALAASPLCACRTPAATPAPDGAAVEPRPAPDVAADRPFYEGSEGLREAVHRRLAQVPGASDARRLELAQQILGVGEPAIPVLLEALSSPHPEVRSLSAWTLGLAGDRRAAPPLRALTSDPVPYVALDAANSLLSLGDDAGLARLVEGLADPDPRLRSRSILALERRTGRTMDFRPDDPPHDRAAAIARWRAWLTSRVAGAP